MAVSEKKKFPDASVVRPPGKERLLAVAMIPFLLEVPDPAAKVIIPVEVELSCGIAFLECEIAVPEEAVALALVDTPVSKNKSKATATLLILFKKYFTALNEQLDTNK